MTELRIRSGAAEARRRIGPVPWYVLEELLLGDGEVGTGGFVVRASARRLAASVSLDKDTVARALAALGRAGVVACEPQPNDGGRFGLGAYRIGPVPGVLRVDDGTAVPQPILDRPHHRTRPRTCEATQLTLIDLTPTDDTHPRHPDRRRTPSPDAPTNASSTDNLDPKHAGPPQSDDALAPGVPPPVPVRVRERGRERDRAPGTGSGPC